MALKRVLIESDWNLKWIFIRPLDHRNSVLIESDWNLKTFKTTYNIEIDEY